MSDQAPENVGFVAAGDGDQHFGFPDAGLLQSPDAAGVALDDLGVQTLIQQLAAVQALLDDDDLVPLPGETAGHHGADRSATKHDDSHWVRST